MPDDPLHTVASVSRPPVSSGQVINGRYTLVEKLDAGGFAEVWSASDSTQVGEVVLKLIELTEHAEAERMMRAAPIEAQLRHPGIVPLLDRGVDGSVLWLVMERVKGDTLEQHIARAHGSEPAQFETRAIGQTNDEDAPGSGPDGLAPIRRLLQVLVQAARAVGTAHDRGVIHRDLKPDNIMCVVADEVLVAKVIDWGLARTLPMPGQATPVVEPLHPVSASLGVPDFLPPERLDDDGDVDDARSDVFALGAILFRILTGRRLRRGLSMRALKAALAAGQSLPVEPLHAPLVEEHAPEWLQVCQQAVDPDPDKRPPHGRAFAEALEMALARAELRRLGHHLDEAGRLEAEAERQRATARQKLESVRPWEGVDSRREAWQCEERARRYAGRALDHREDWLRGVQKLLQVRPLLPEARIVLAERQADGLRDAEDSGDQLAIQRALVTLRDACDTVQRGLAESVRDGERATIDASADPSVPPRVAQCQALLEGPGYVSLKTDRDDVRVEYAPIDDVERRWVPGVFGALGTAPLDRHPIPAGRGVLKLTAAADDIPTVTYPIYVRRGEHWDGQPPALDPKLGRVDEPGDPSPIVPMPPNKLLGANDIYVPRGWAIIGGDPHAIDGVGRRRIWLDGFVMRRYPVTHREYIDFLNDHVDRGLADVARAHAPMVPPMASQRMRRFIYIGDAAGRYACGDAHLDEPVCLVKWASARYFAAWEAKRSGRPWRLPCEWEYEKAARGADGRRLPWGMHMEAFRSQLANSTPEEACPVPVDRKTEDVSPYGVHWLAGNMRTWCLDAWRVDGPTDGTRFVSRAPDLPDPPPRRLVRGAFWASPVQSTSAASRFADLPESHMVTCGIRLVYSCPAGWLSESLGEVRGPQGGPGVTD